MASLQNKKALSILSANIKEHTETQESKGYIWLFTDIGGEFYNSDVKKYLTSKGIKLYTKLPTRNQSRHRWMSQKSFKREGL